MEREADTSPPASALLRVLLADALDNVCVKPGKSILALLGIAMGVAAVIALLHIGAAARAQALRSFEAVGADFVTILAPAGGPNKPEISLDDVGTIPLDNVGLIGVAPMIRSNTMVFEGHDQWPVDVVGTTSEFAPILRLNLAAGRFVSPLDGWEPFAVIGAGIADKLSAARGHRPEIGERFRVGTAIFRVIGVLTAQPINPLIGLEPDKLVITNVQGVRRLAERSSVESIVGRLAAHRSAEAMSAAVVSYFRPRLHGETVNFTLAGELIASIGQQMRIYDTLLLAIGAISLGIGGIGIMNVMLMSVMERTEEVGLRAAIGASPRIIRFMFLMESVTLATAGSVAGLLFGVAAAWGFAIRSGWTFQFAPEAIPLGLVMAVTVGVFFGIYPAHRAASLHPVEALRRA